MAKSHARRKGQKQQFPQILILILFLMAVISVLGLDYIKWTSGKDSFLFKSRETQAKEPPQEKEPGTPVLAEIVLKQIRSLNITASRNSQFWDSDGIFHLKFDISEKSYKSLKNALEAEFATFQAVIELRSAQDDDEKKHYLWKVADGGGGRMSLLISCPKEMPPQEDIPATISQNGKVAIILDDMGYSLEAINQVVRMNQKITVSILPNTPRAVETAEIAREKGLEVLLHLPMESDNSGSAQNNVQGIVLSSMGKRRIIQIFSEDLSQVPYARGVNNHMGSKITKDKDIMKIILEQVKKNNLFFVDSMTTGASLAYDLALSMGIPAAKRHVFLDGVLTEEYIAIQMEELFHKAKRLGGAIGICHPTEVTLKVLADKLPEMEKYGLELVFASALLQ